MAFIVTAIHTFSAEHGDELDFSAGEKITIIEKDEAFGDGWWKGRNAKGEEGLFPATYISEEPLADEPPTSAAATPAEGAAGAATPAAAAAAAAGGHTPTPAPVPGGGAAAAASPALGAAAPGGSKVGSPIPPAPPSPKNTAARANTPPPPTAPESSNGFNGNGNLNGLGLTPSYGDAAASEGQYSNVRSSMLDVTGSQSSVVASAAAGARPSATPASAVPTTAGSGGNVMGHTIGEVQEAIDTLSTNPKGVILKDPQARPSNETGNRVPHTDDMDDDDEPLGIRADTRARLAEQAKRANEERDSQRESGPVADLIYSDESDDEEDEPNRSIHKTINGHGLGSSVPDHLDTKAGLAGGVNEPPTIPAAADKLSSPSPPLPPPDSFPKSATHSPSLSAGNGQYGGNNSGYGKAATGTATVAGLAGAAAAAAAASRPSPGATPTPPAPETAALASPGQRTSSLHSSPSMPSQPFTGSHATSTPPTDHPSQLGGALSVPNTPPFPEKSYAGSTSAPGTGARTPASPPTTWTVDDVVAWARSKGFDDSICSKFIEHDISGDVLLELDANLLKELDIPQFGKRVRIAQAIKELQRPVSITSHSSQQPSPHDAHSNLSNLSTSSSVAALATTPAAGTQSSRNYGTPPSAFGVAAAAAAAGDELHQAWSHGRKVSMSPSTQTIEETRAVDASTVNGSNHSTMRSTSSMPVTPATPSVTVKDGLGLVKRDSTGSLGHKRNKSSVDKAERLSFFGRGRKAPPPNANGPISPASERSGSSRLGFSKDKSAAAAAAAAANTHSRNTSDSGAGGAGVASTAAGAAAAAGGAPTGGAALRQIGKPDKAGYLKKRGEYTWKTRYFILKGSYLYYLKSENEDRAKGRIDLKGHRIIVDENTNPGSYGFRLVGPGDTKPHFFSSQEQSQIREWMKALMKATIARDYSVPVTSSCNIPTIPLAEAQALQPRPPSPAERDATQRANRRENVNQLTPRDASVLMSLDTTNSTRRVTSHGGLTATPSRPSRDMRRPSTSEKSRAGGRPSIGSYYHAEEDTNNDLLQWVNSTLPSQYPRVAQFPNSFVSGEVIFLLVKHLAGIEPKPPVPSSAFAQDATGLPNVDGLFAMMDLVIDAGIDSAGVSLNDIRAGDPSAIANLVDSVRSWAHSRGVA